MEALLIINGLLAATTLYFIKHVHSEFKEMGRSVQTLKERFAELSTKVQEQIKSIKERLGFMVEKEDKK